MLYILLILSDKKLKLNSKKNKNYLSYQFILGKDI